MKRWFILFILTFQIFISSCGTELTQNNSSLSYDNSINDSTNELSSTMCEKYQENLTFQDIADIEKINDDIIALCKNYYNVKPDLLVPEGNQIEYYMLDESGSYFLIIPRYQGSTLTMESIYFDEQEFIKGESLLKLVVPENYGMLLQTNLPEAGPNLIITIEYDGKIATWMPTYSGKGDETFPIKKDGVLLMDDKNSYDIVDDSAYGLSDTNDNRFLNDTSMLAACDDAGMWGFLNKSGWVIPPQYEFASDFSEGLALVYLSDSLVGYINSKNNMVIGPLVAENAGSFSNGLAKINNNGEWMYIDSNSQQVVAPQIGQGFDFSDNRCPKLINGKYGFMDITGNVVIQPQFDSVQQFNNGVAIISSGDKYGLIDINGTYLVEPILEDIMSFEWWQEKMIPAKYGGKWGFMNIEGNWAIQPAFDSASVFSEGRAPIKINDTWGYIDADGKIVVEPQFNEVNKFSQGLAAVSKISSDSQIYWGFIDKAGQIVIPLQFDDATFFSEGLAAVQVGSSLEGSKSNYAIDTTGKWGFLQMDGDWAILPQYGYALNFKSGLARVAEYPVTFSGHGTFGYINSDGEWLTKFIG